MKRTHALVLGLVLAVAAGSALADPKTLTWTNATQNTDNTPIAATGPGSLVRTTVEYGTCNAGKTAITTKAGEMFVFAPATTLQVSPVVVQEYCFDAWHSNTYATTFAPSTATTVVAGNSVRSGVVVATVLPPQPAPPSNLATTAANPIAYTVQFSLNRMARLGVGRVPDGTQCDTSTSVTSDWQLTGVASPLYRVPRETVIWAGNVKPQAVFASCG